MEKAFPTNAEEFKKIVSPVVARTQPPAGASPANARVGTSPDISVSTTQISSMSPMPGTTTGPSATATCIPTTTANNQGQGPSISGTYTRSTYTPPTPSHLPQPQRESWLMKGTSSLNTHILNDSRNAAQTNISSADEQYFSFSQTLESTEFDENLYEHGSLSQHFSAQSTQDKFPLSIWMHN